MKNSRPRIKHAQIPHSIAHFIESLTNRTAAALLSFICRKTIGFGLGTIEFSYRQLSKALNVGTRALCNAARILEERGFIVRDRPNGGSYRWAVILDKDEIIEDRNCIYITRETLPSQGGDKIDRSGGIRSIVHDPHARSILSPRPKAEQSIQHESKSSASKIEQKTEPLKKLIKETSLKKKQQQDSLHLESGSPTQQPVEPEPNSVSPTKSPAVCKTNDDEPLHKFCLRELKNLGVSQRVARQLCKEHDHKLIASVIKTAPQRPGIKNLAAYIVSEIKDGGYEQTQNSPSAGQKNAHQVSGGRSNYAHLTNDKIGSRRHNSVKPATDAPIVYKSYQQTKIEQEAMELQKLEEEKAYYEEGKLLAQRFKSLPDNLQLRLKLAASVQLSKLVPMTGTREQMLQDKTFQRLANRTVLECFFTWIDEGLSENQALLHLESKAAA